jgi:phosphate transport system permease protein
MPDQASAGSGEVGTGIRNTVVPTRRAAGPPQQRLKLGGFSRPNFLNLVGAAVSALCLALLLFGRLAPFTGLIGFFLVAYVMFLAVYTVLVSLNDDWPAVIDKVITVVLYTAAALMFTALGFVVFYTIGKGLPALVHINFFTRDMKGTSPLAPVTKGGIKHALIGTLWMMAIALTITVPLGLAAAVYINEVGGRLSRAVRTIVDAMTALPSIVAGLFIYATWILALHKEFSGFAAALGISVMMLPIIIRASDVVLRLVPGNLREASAALGAPNGAPSGTSSSPPPGRVWPRRSSWAWPGGSVKPLRSCCWPATRRSPTPTPFMGRWSRYLPPSNLSSRPRTP